MLLKATELNLEEKHAETVGAVIPLFSGSSSVTDANPHDIKT